MTTRHEVGSGEPRWRTSQLRELSPAALALAIVEASNDAVFAKTLDGVVLSWNRAAERMYGYCAEEMIGQPLARLVPADRADELGRLLGRIAAGDLVEDFETVRQTKDGQLLDVSITVSPIHDAAGAVIGASTIARDISERKAP